MIIDALFYPLTSKLYAGLPSFSVTFQPKFKRNSLQMIIQEAELSAQRLEEAVWVFMSCSSPSSLERRKDPHLSCFNTRTLNCPVEEIDLLRKVVKILNQLEEENLALTDEVISNAHEIARAVRSLHGQPAASEEFQAWRGYLINKVQFLQSIVNLVLHRYAV